MQAGRVIAGLDVFKRVFELLDETTEVVFYVKDGEAVKKGDLLAVVRVISESCFQENALP